MKNEVEERKIRLTNNVPRYERVREKKREKERKLRRKTLTGTGKQMFNTTM
jgi:hypothetical protein